MGVAGLWDIIRLAGQTRSLTHLSVIDGFEANPDNKRGFRIGIDASIWFFHATYGKEGENPELRTLFFRCATLMRSPFLPLFVFDGPKRPSVKRGKRIGKNNHWLTTGMKNIIDAFGFEWRTAPGEAEAELAYLNRIGIIDGILSDDVDNFLFGAEVVIRNPSNTLSGNRANPVKNSVGKDDKNHTVIYRLKDISENPDINLTRGGLILIGLLSGGDYHQAGLPRCGTVIAHGLAKCGFGDTLYQAALTHSPDDLPAFLANWRNELRHQLRTNSQGHMGRKNPTLAKSVPEDFPNIEILLSYTSPITSETEGRESNNLKITWNREPDLGKLAALCELYFEWGVKETIIKRFRTVIWPSVVLRVLRRAAIDIDERLKITVTPTTPRKNGKKTVVRVGTPSKMITKNFSSMRLGSPSNDDFSDDNLIVKIHSTRQHASTDGILEYRLEIAPAHLVRLTEAGVKGTRPAVEADEWDDDDDDEGSSKKPPPDPSSHLRVWMPASMVRMVEPDLVDQFDDIQENKRNKKAGKRRVDTSKAKVPTSAEEESLSEEEKVTTKKKIITPQRTLGKSKTYAGNDRGKKCTDLKTVFAVSKVTKSTKTRKPTSTDASRDQIDVKRAAATELSDDSDFADLPSIRLARSAIVAVESLDGYVSGSESDEGPLLSDKVVPLQVDDLFAQGSPKRSKPKETRGKFAQPSTDSDSCPSHPTQSPLSKHGDIVSTSDENGMLLVSRGMKPRPFPLSFRKKTTIVQTREILSDERRPPTVSKLKQSKPNTQRIVGPQTSQNYPSPGSKCMTHHSNADEECDGNVLHPRPGSASPMLNHAEPPSQVASEAIVVIDISSDSDTSPSRLMLPPLLVAKARARTSKDTTRLVEGSSLSDIIDLTSP